MFDPLFDRRQAPDPEGVLALAEIAAVPSAGVRWFPGDALICSTPNVSMPHATVSVCFVACHDVFVLRLRWWQVNFVARHARPLFRLCPTSAVSRGDPYERSANAQRSVASLWRRKLRSCGIEQHQ